MDKKYSLLILLFLLLVIYAYIYFFLPYSVFFNFDMPLQALKIQEYIKSGSFLTAQYFSEESVWRNISWGPSAVFFYALFLKISSDPLVVSYLLSAVNLFGIAAVVALVWRYFSKQAAIISGFLLAFNPYWVTYARIIFTPSPLTLFIPTSMFLFFESIFKKKAWAQILLPVSWVILIQIYLPTYSFIVTSLVILLFFYKAIRIKYLAIGALFSLILMLPTILFYKDNPVYIQRVIEAPSLFTPPEKTFLERIEKVTLSFVQFPVGGKFEWQTSYGYKDFIKTIPGINYISVFLTALFIIALIWNLYMGFAKKQINRFILFFWVICPVWSLLVLWVTDLTPRYYLIAFPAAMALISLFLSDLFKINKIFSAIPLFIVVYWVLFNSSYNSFIKSYDYPNGKFADVAETPYIFLKEAVRWTIDDSKARKCDIILTNNPENPVFDLWLETKYIWNYVYHRKIEDSAIRLKPCFYVINYRYMPKELGISNYKVFGTFVAFRYEPPKN